MLLELIGDLVNPSLGADLVLVPAGRAGDADGADHVVADLDRQRTLGGDDAAQMHRSGRRVVLDTLGEHTRGDTEGARGVGLALAVLDRMRRGVVAAQHHDRLAVAPDHGDRNAVALRLARIGGGRGDGQGRGERQVFVIEQLRARRRGQRYGKTRPDDTINRHGSSSRQSNVFPHGRATIIQNQVSEDDQLAPARGHTERRHGIVVAGQIDIAEWIPQPKRLTENELADHRRGRDTFLAEVAHAIGGNVLVIK